MRESILHQVLHG